MPDERTSVSAAPEKRFFVSMLVRDIELIPAVLDLVDNSVDGARRVTDPGDENRYDGFKVEVHAVPDRFEIRDNCGGIEAEVARNYAFRFGRPQGWEGATDEVGQFGIGMKRALFKLGTAFTVESTAATSRFVLPVDVTDWLAADPPAENPADDPPDEQGSGAEADPASWAFEFDSVEENVEFASEDRGTVVSVDQLHEWVSRDFDDHAFLLRLRSELRWRHLVPLQQGLVVTLNGDPITPPELQLLSGPEVAPIHYLAELPVNGRQVALTVYAGLAAELAGEQDEDEDPSEIRAESDAGWYLFCNDRLLLRHDKSRLTGWASAAPAYHPEYRQFRGYAFLSGDAELMPWTTTKTGIDEDSETFSALQEHLFDALQRVLNAIKRLKNERRQRLPEEQIANAALAVAEPVALRDLPESTSFRLPESVPGPVANLRWIRYSVDPDDFQKVADDLGAEAPGDVGRHTFDFYRDNQVAD